MSYQVLARKWRPKKFSDLAGQEHVTQALLNSIKQSRMHHAYLLTGTRGVGKTTIARILAKSLNCLQQSDGEPCGQCDACLSIDEGRFVDLMEIDAASNTGIDNIREVLENAQYMPTVGRYKVYIIDEVHMLSKSAFNAMLKTLEEPPEHVKFILATTDSQKVPITVLSRCLQFVLRNLTSEQIIEYLTKVLKTEQIEYEEASLILLARAARGSMRDALSLLDQSIALGNGLVATSAVQQMLGVIDRQYLYDSLIYLHNQDAENLYKQINQLAYRAIGFDNLLDELAVILKDLAVAKAIGKVSSEYNQTFEQLAQQLTVEEIQLYYQTVIQGKKDLILAPDEYSGFLMIILRMLSFKPITVLDVKVGQQLYYAETTAEQPAKIKKKINEIKKPALNELKPVAETEVQSLNELNSVAETEVQPPNPATVVEQRQISAANWLEVIEAVNKKIGPHCFMTRNMAFVSLIGNRLQCAIAEDLELNNETESLNAVIQAFKQLYNVDLEFTYWQQQMVTTKDLKKQYNQQLKNNAIEYINADQKCNEIKKIFDAQWDVDSTQLKNIK